MATVTRENIQPLHDKLIVKVEKEDYLPSFEKKIKSLTKSANLPGFRKGMVPTGLMKKMYGRDIMREEIEIALNEKLKSYIEKEKLHLIGQPIVLEQLKAIDLEEVNQPVDHEFAFEIGLQPEIKVDVKDIPVTRYLVNVSEEKIDADIKNLQRGHGKKIDLDVIGNRNEDTTIDANFKETDKDGNEIENGFNTPVNHLAMTKFTDAAFELL
ncbi:MAG: trigger factor family protein, partial [Chitinophagaceae bacterium]|nr:trigger factor family protein [Chitinophagaceae bacterium]